MAEQPQIDANAIRVLITGFGPFYRYKENPAWLAVKALHNTTFYCQPVPPKAESPKPGTADINDHPPPSIPPPSTNEDVQMDGEEDETPPDDTPRQVHITTLQIPMSYQSVLSTVPGLHSKNPTVPYPTDDPSYVIPPPPPQGYDFIFHVAVAGRGPLRLEKVSHKLNFRMKDAEGQYAPIVIPPPKDQSDEDMMDVVTAGFHSISGNYTSHIGDESHDHSGLPPGVQTLAGGAVTVFGNPGPDGSTETPTVPENVEVQQHRGFGKSYENMPDELSTDVDVARLIHHLKETGIDQVYISMDAGHYLCDFTYYCSLAESKRLAKQFEVPPVNGKDKQAPPKGIPVLAMHCGPINQPLCTEDVTEAIRKIVVWVCENHLVPRP